MNIKGIALLITLLAGRPVLAGDDFGVTCIRLGGGFSGVRGYRWKTMLSDPDLRPQYNSCWYPFESRGWSIVEFIFFDNHRVWLQPHGRAFRMAREHYQPLAVQTTPRSPRMTFKNPIPYGVPEIDVLVASAARNEGGRRAGAEGREFRTVFPTNEDPHCRRGPTPSDRPDRVADRRQPERGQHGRPADQRRPGHPPACWDRPGLRP
jgi:hypothetical protein